MKRLFILLALVLYSQTLLFSQNYIRDISTYKDYTNRKRTETIDELNRQSNGLRGLNINVLTGSNLPQRGNSNIGTFGKNSNQNIFPMETCALYRDVVRRYTWLEGLGDPISQEEANHLPYYFRLSMINEAGHYHLVEAMHGKSLTSLHPLSTYILDKGNDISSQNQEWRDKLLTVGQWVFYSDPSGVFVLEERAYEAKEKDAKLVYSMQPVRNDSNHVTIAYTDSYGYPADMNEDDRFTYGSVVYITYDKQGCDSIIDFLDGEGYRKTNTNGADQTRCVYDDKCRPILVTSHNCIGDYAMDNWENCGVKYIYDDVNNSYSMICVDDDLQPMRMPAKRAGKDNTYIRRDIRKDKWGRKVEEVMLTADGEKDVTLSGIHRITFSYTSDGRLTETKYFDLEGNPLTNK